MKVRQTQKRTPEPETAVEPWSVIKGVITYHGQVRDLPADFLPCFAIPVPTAWFTALFATHKKNKKVVYKSDAYAVATGYILYSRKEAYDDAEGVWASTLTLEYFAVQVEWAESARVGAGRAAAALAALQVSLLQPDTTRTHLHQVRRFGTTQGRFLTFLMTGDLSDLETTASEHEIGGDDGTPNDPQAR